MLSHATQRSLIIEAMYSLTALGIGVVALCNSIWLFFTSETGMKKRSILIRLLFLDIPLVGTMAACMIYGIEKLELSSTIAYAMFWAIYIYYNSHYLTHQNVTNCELVPDDKQATSRAISDSASQSRSARK